MVLKFKVSFMAKVILLCGSPRENSNTLDVLNVCAREIESNGVETEILSLKGKNIQSCKACLSCQETGNCVLNDGLDEIIEKIREADGFIPAAPVYFGTARGDIMAALQRINNMIIAGSTYWNMVVAGAEGTAFEDTEGIQTIKLFGQNVAKIIKKLGD